MLQIKGFGLSGDLISINIDGVACQVNQALSSDSNLVCETGAKATASLINTSQPGAYGLKHNYANPTDPK